MKFPGYWVAKTNKEVTINITEFDETELDPETDWKEAWQNRENQVAQKGFVDFEDALDYVRTLLKS